MKLKITVHGVAYEVDVEVLDAQDEMRGSPSPLPPIAAAAVAAPASAPAGPGPAPKAVNRPAPGDTGGVASPIAGTVLELKCKVGDAVEQGQDLVVIEAMKMETAIAAPCAGTIKTIHVAAGDAVRETQVLVDFE